MQYMLNQHEAKKRGPLLKELQELYVASGLKPSSFD